MIPTIVATAVLALIIFLAIRHIYKEKKAGNKCIGCSMSRSCSKKTCH